MKHYISIFILFILVSCGQTEIKKVIYTFPNGIVGKVRYYSDESDTLTYRIEVFYLSGKRDFVGNFVEDRKEGVWTWWYENEKIKDKCKYKEGYYIDTIYHWYENGNLRQIEFLSGQIGEKVGDKYSGTTIRYFENGKIKEQITTIDDKLEGKHIVYNEKGGWYMRTYSNNKLWGPTIEYCLDSNNETAVGQFMNGKEHGLWKWFDKDSIIFKTAVYKNGIWEGPYILYYTNGKIKESSILKNGTYDGEVKYFDENAKQTKTEFYEDGKLKWTKKK